LATLTVSEMEHGIWRTQEVHRQQRRQRFLEELLAAVPALPLTIAVARHLGRVDAECRKVGVVIPFQDLVIGVTALEFYWLGQYEDTGHCQVTSIALGLALAGVYWESVG